MKASEQPCGIAHGINGMHPYLNAFCLLPSAFCLLPSALAGSEVKLRIFPVREAARAAQRRALEVEPRVFVFVDFDFASEEEVFAFRAKTRLVQRPPLFVRVVLPEQAQLASGAQQQGGQHGGRYIREGGWATGCELRCRHATLRVAGGVEEDTPSYRDSRRQSFRRRRQGRWRHTRLSVNAEMAAASRKVLRLALTRSAQDDKSIGSRS